MMIRALAAGAAAVLLAGPAFAACEQEITRLDQAVVAAETGAAAQDGLPATEHQREVLAPGAKAKSDAEAVEEGGLPATKHQEEVLSGSQENAGQAAAGGGGSVEATSPHQRQVTGSATGAGDAQASELLEEARELAAQGKEQECMEKVTQAASRLGVE